MERLALSDASTVRPLLKQTQLETRPLQVVYDAGLQGWNAKAFHRAVDGKGAAVIMCKAKSWNTRGWFDECCFHTAIQSL
jgi:hypothetical protein